MSYSVAGANVVLTEFEDGDVDVYCYRSLKDLMEDQLTRTSSWSGGGWADRVHLDSLRELRVKLDAVIAKVEFQINEP